MDRYWKEVLDENADLPIKTWKRDWRKYSREMLNNELSKITFDLDIKDVQDMWNNIENHLILFVELWLLFATAR